MAAINTGKALRRGAAATVAAVMAGAIASCATDDVDTQPSISIPFDPYEFDEEELLKRAEDHCGAYGLKAVYQNETIDPHSVRWRYRHYRCV
ncbi:MAG: hypothetical protein ACE5FO_11540 [Parvularculaceae bacterium]